jgi:lipopolysaccharide/colanic/teichoic acid biosynthesis glycosyltransferase
MERANPVSISRSEPLAMSWPAEAQVRVPRWKRALDITCVLLGAPGWVPLMLIVALYIRLVSPGPIFFRQPRIGYRERRFICLKFRSMKVNVEISTHRNHLNTLIRSNQPMTKMDVKGDPRLIPFARFLRATGLDELPQLINVLRGEMSIVGPRPCTQYEYDCYETWHKRRFNALPGLTGLWQVNGKNKTTFSEMIELDVYYAQNSSVAMDLKIMFKTFPVLISQIREIGRRWL